MKEELEQLLADIRADIITQQRVLGMGASGKSAASLTIKVTETSGELTGDKSFYFQEHGRRPGKFAPPEFILDWIKRKGIQPKDPKTTLEQLAFMFNRKLAKKGSDIWLKIRPGLDIKGTIKYNVKVFTQVLVKKFKAQLIEHFKKIFK